MRPESAPASIQRALRAYRVVAERTLLGLAWAGIEGPSGQGPLVLSRHLALPDPGGWRGALDRLLEGEAARALSQLGIDPGVQLLIEIDRLERQGVGPAGGVLGRQGAPSEAWHRGVRAIRSVGPLGQRLRQYAARDDLPEAMRRRAAQLIERPVAPVPLVRMAAADRAQSRYETEGLVEVDGAPGWAVEVRIDPTADGMLMGVARRVWVGEGDAPVEPPRVELRIHVNGERRTARTIGSARSAIVWYDDGDLGPHPEVEARAVAS